MKKNLIIPLVVASLSIGFVIVSLLVLITKGGNSSFIRSKLKIGGLILAMTAVFYACSGNSNELMCYNSVDENKINNTNENGNNNINNNNDNGNDLVVMCYEVVELPNYVSINNFYDEGFIILNLTKSNIVSGEIECSTGSSQFSYVIRKAADDLQTMGDIYQTGDIDLSDVVNGKSITKFEIAVDESLKEGDYYLFFYEFSSDYIKNYPNNFLTIINLKIVK